MIQFSVIIPNYNHAPFLRERIESVLSQTYEDFELILLDDCSTDNSKEIIESYRQHPKVSHIVYAEQNSGSPFRQWLKGIELAKGNWIWIAESDDHSSNIFLETASQLISRHPSAGLFYCDAAIQEENNGIVKTFAAGKNSYFNTDKWSAGYFSKGTAEIEECLGIRCTINNASSALMKKDLLSVCMADAAGFQFHGDWYCYLAIAGKADIVYSPAVMNSCRIHSSSIRSQLPEDGKHRAECFRILLYLCNQLRQYKNKKLVQQFVVQNLRVGLVSGRKEWKNYFWLNKRLACKVFFKLLQYRLGMIKKVTA